MVQLDRRIPAVYVDIEDRSLVLPTIQTGESVFGVLLSDRGPHNRVVEIEPQDNARFQKLFGQPNFEKYGQGHYNLDKAIAMGARAYIIRPCAMTEDDAVVEADRMAIANSYIKFNDPNGSSELIRGVSNGFVFNGTDQVQCTSLTIQLFNVGDYIIATDSHAKAREIIAKDTTTYKLTLESAYPDTTTVADAYMYFPGSTEVTEHFTFNHGSNIVIASDTTSLTYLSEEQWIYSKTDKPAVGEQAIYARQIIAIDSTTGYITLDEAYEGTTSSSPEHLYTYIPFGRYSEINLRDEDGLDILDTDNLWYFYAYGAGSYYNNLYIKAVRNIEYEKIFMTGDFNVSGNDTSVIKYPYSFMDLAIYRRNDDGSSTMLEGPWVVSLLNKTAEGQLIKDINTGKELYIVTVINENSELIQVKEALGAQTLLTVSTPSNPITYPYEPDNLKRLQVQSIFSEQTVLTTNTRGLEGFYLYNGEDGSLFTSQGRLNLNNDYIALVSQAYAGTLVSTDGTIESIVQSVYPWYTFEYTLSGGYNSVIQNAARGMVDNRGDTMLLADTGANYSSPNDDLNARLNEVPWNTFNAMLYVQYREIFDIYTGKKFYVNPVYHAVERHLYVDDKYWLSEPVANIEKGAIQEPIKLAYRASFTKLGDLMDKEMNPVIVEPDGKYILTQFTTWKRLSILKRAHAVKFIHYIKRNIPKILKDLLQRKATQYWINQAAVRVNGFMQPFVDNGNNERFASITSFNAQVLWDDLRSELTVVLQIRPIRAIERIHVLIQAF